MYQHGNNKLSMRTSMGYVRRSRSIFVILLILGITSIFGFGLHQWLGYKSANWYTTLGDDYNDAIKNLYSKEPEKGVDQLKKLMVTDSSYGILATLQYASYLCMNKDYVQAGQMYQSISDNKSAPQIFRDFAGLMAVSASLNAKEVDGDAAIQRLKAYMDTAPMFKPTAQLMLGSLYLSMGQKENAHQEFNAVITSFQATQDSREAAKMLLVLAS